MSKVFIGLDTICLIAFALGKPILNYPLTFCTFTVMVIAMSFVVRMDFITLEGLGDSDLVGTERQPLNAAV